jgi:glyoxylase-like metal-dependent hydrolase (beta-lactamase superfamily II)
MTTEVADGVFQLSPMPYVNVFALRGGDGWTIIDAAIGQRNSRLLSQLRRIGVGPNDVDQIVLTHGHFDHAGGAESLRSAMGARRVLVDGLDLAAVQAGRNASGERRSALAKLDKLDPGYPPVPTAQALDPGQSFAIGDGRSLVPVPTPGHTDGHLSFHIPELGVVIGGDTVFNIFRMRPSPGFLCSDADRNLASILKLAELQPSMLLLAHGRPVRGDVEGKLRTLAAA